MLNSPGPDKNNNELQTSKPEDNLANENDSIQDNKEQHYDFVTEAHYLDCNFFESLINEGIILTAHLEKPEGIEEKFILHRSDVFWESRYEINPERYQDYCNVMREEIKRKELERFHKANTDNEHIDMGYVSIINPDGKTVDQVYTKQLVNALKSNTIKHVNELPNYLALSNSNESSSNAIKQIKITSAQLLAQIHGPNIYELQISSLLDNFESTLEIRTIPLEMHYNIMNLFAQGRHIGLSYYHRYETLKQQEKIWHYRRMYKYGYSELLQSFGIEKPIQQERQEQTLLNAGSRSHIITGLVEGSISIADMTDTMSFNKKLTHNYIFYTKKLIGRNGLYEKFPRHALQKDATDNYETLTADEKKVFQERIKKIGYFGMINWEYYLPHERNMLMKCVSDAGNDPKSEQYENMKEVCKGYERHITADPLNSVSMQKYFSITRDELIQLVEVAKKEFLEEFPSVCAKFSFDTLDTGRYSSDLQDTNTDELYVNGVYIKQILEDVSDIAAEYKINIDNLKDIVSDRIKMLIDEVKVLIRNKEYTKEPIQKGKNIGHTYKSVLRERLKKIKSCMRILKDIGRDYVDADLDTISHEYKVHHKTAFAAEKLKHTLQNNILDTQNLTVLTDQIAGYAAKVLIEKHRHRKVGKHDPLGYHRKLSPKAFELMLQQKVFFAQGYFLVVKSVIENTKERTAFWNNTKNKTVSNALDIIEARCAKGRATVIDLSLFSVLIKKHYANNAIGKQRYDNVMHAFYDNIASRVDRDLHEINRVLYKSNDGDGGAEIINNAAIYMALTRTRDALSKYALQLYGHELEENDVDKNISEKVDNMRYQGQYPSDFLGVCYRAHQDAEKIYDALEKYPLVREEVIIRGFGELEKHKKYFYTTLVQTRFTLHTKKGGKMHRMLVSHQESNDTNNIYVWLKETITKEAINSIELELPVNAYGLDPFTKAMIAELVDDCFSQWLATGQDKILISEG